MSLHIFWDNSNIFLVGRNMCKQKEPNHETAFRIHFENLFDFIADKRKVTSAFLAGSIPPGNDALWKKFEELSIIVEKQERGQDNNKEIAVDEAIQLRMSNCVLDNDTPGTICLLTGDGAGHSEGKGFIRQLERVVKKGWKIEVISWDIGCNRKLKEYATENGKYRSLESVYENITFIEKFRPVKNSF